MNTAVVVLALGAAAALGLSLVLTQIGLRYLTPLRGACISVPSSMLAYVALTQTAPSVIQAPNLRIATYSLSWSTR